MMLLYRDVHFVSRTFQAIHFEDITAERVAELSVVTLAQVAPVKSA